MTLRIGSLFSGYGGLDDGVRRAVGGTVAWVSDIDPGACKILAHHHPDTPNHAPCDTHVEGTWNEVNRACDRHMRATGHCARTGTTPP